MEEIKKECGQFEDSFGLYSFVTELSVYLPAASDDLCTDTYRLRDCQSDVWLRMQIKDGRFFMEAASDAMIIRGILYIMIELYNGCDPAEIAESEVDIFELCRLGDSFTAARKNGIGSVSSRIRNFCREYHTAESK